MTTYTVRALDDLTIFTTPRAKRLAVPFSADWDRTIEDLGVELQHLRASDVVIEVATTAPDIRRDGMLRTNARVTHPGVRISFQTRDHGPMTFTCDTYERRWGYQMPSWQANVRAVALSLKALRDVDRHGATKGRQYVGLGELPAGSGAVAMGGMTREQAADIIFGDPAAASVDLTSEIARGKFRLARAKAHPDRNGGDQTQWDRVMEAARVLGLDR